METRTLRTFRSSILLSLICCGVFAQAQEPPDTLWTRRYGGQQAGVAVDFCTLSSGGYFLVGSTLHSFGQDQNIYMVRTDSNGELQWTNIIGTSFLAEIVWDIEGLSGDRIAMIGSVLTHDNVVLHHFIMVVNSDGDTLQYAELPSEIVPIQLLITEEEEFAVLGADYRNWDSTHYDYGLCYLDSALNLIWQVSYGGRWEDYPVYLILTTERRFVIVGRTYSFVQNGPTTWLLTCDLTGDSLWSQVLCPDEEHHCGVSVAFQRSESEAFLLGRAICDTGYFWLCSTSLLGDTIHWTRCPGIDLGIYDAKRTVNGDFIIVGTLIVRVDSTGSVRWTIPRTGDKVEVLVDGGFAVLSTIVSEDTGYDLYLLRYAADTSVSARDTPGALASYAFHDPFPNPFNAQTTIRFEIPVTGKVSLKVFDVTGRFVQTIVDEVKTAGEHSVHFDAQSLASGIYFLRMEAGEFVQVRKMALVR